MPQTSILGPAIHVISQRHKTSSYIATICDDIAVLAVGNSMKKTVNLQSTTKINGSESVHVNFTNRKYHSVELNKNNAT